MLQIYNYGMILSFMSVLYSNIQGQFIYSLYHTYVLIISSVSILYVKNPTIIEKLYHFGYNTSITYFIWDTLFILFKDRTQKKYIIHHLFAIPILLISYYGIGGRKESFLYVYSVELSNSLISIWLYIKDKLKDKRMSNLLLPYVAYSYIPARSLFLPYAGWKVFNSLIWSSNKFTNTLNITYSILIIMIQFMSWMFSYKLYKMLSYKKKEVEEYNNPVMTHIWDTLVNLKTINSLPVLISFLKLAFNCLIVVKPLQHPIMTMLVISDNIYLPFKIIKYTTLIENEWLQIVYRHSVYFKNVSILFILQWIYNYSFSNNLFIVFTLYVLYYTIVFTNYSISPNLITIVLTTYIPILYKAYLSGHLLTWPLCYLLALTVKSFKLPEIMYKNKYINSDGLMNLFIMLGDVMLLTIKN